MVSLTESVLKDPPEQVRAFVRDGLITQFPVKRTRRRALLNEVAQAFEPGRRYPEADVDRVLKGMIEDHCTLRRYLVDEEFLSRNTEGVYWRTGGDVVA
jgi:hypothetical protein